LAVKKSKASWFGLPMETQAALTNLYTLGGLASADMRLIVAASSMKRLLSMMTHSRLGELIIVLMQSMRTG